MDWKACVYSGAAIYCNAFSVVVISLVALFASVATIAAYAQHSITMECDSGSETVAAVSFLLIYVLVRFTNWL